MDRKQIRTGIIATAATLAAFAALVWYSNYSSHREIRVTQEAEQRMLESHEAYQRSTEKLEMLRRLQAELDQQERRRPQDRRRDQAIDDFNQRQRDMEAERPGQGR